jgi:hypothetical protein
MTTLNLEQQWGSPSDLSREKLAAPGQQSERADGHPQECQIFLILHHGDQCSGWLPRKRFEWHSSASA